MHCVVVCRFKLQQLCEICEGMAAAGGPLKDVSMFFDLYFGLLGHTHSYTRLAGCSDLVYVARAFMMRCLWPQPALTRFMICGRPFG